MSPTKSIKTHLPAPLPLVRIFTSTHSVLPRSEPIYNYGTNMRALVLLAALVGGVCGRMAGRLPGGYGALASEFSCDDRPFGYYADVENDCKAFHVCQPVYEEAGTLSEVAHFSFMCGDSAIFSQDSLTCAHPNEALPCAEAPSYYDASNADFGVVPEEEEGLEITA